MLNNIWASDPITIDGLFNDWSEVPVAFFDANGDGYDEDIGRTQNHNDNDFLFHRLSFFNSEQLLQDFNGIRRCALDMTKKRLVWHAAFSTAVPNCRSR